MSWERSEFFALAARLNAQGIAEARPSEDDETAGSYLSKLYGWVMDASAPKPVLDEPRRNTRAMDHLIDHDSEALLQGKTLDPKLRGVAFTYRRGSL